MNLKVYLKKQSSKIDRELRTVLPLRIAEASALYEAMRYSVMSGGKRIRPILLLEAARVVGGSEKKAMLGAAAVELVHNYSLIHDDLPCMDNDRLRRGLPTCHVRFGETTALLAGDALLTLAFEVLSRSKDAGSVLILARAIGAHGMIAGQAMDIEFQKKEADLPVLEMIHARKSGCLIAASLEIGARLGGGSAPEARALCRFGRYLGLLFQIVDDLLDKEGVARLLGETEARAHACEAHSKAKAVLLPFGARAGVLMACADLILERKK